MISGVEDWHGLMEAQQGPVNNLNNPIEPAVQQVNIIKVTKTWMSQNQNHTIKIMTKFYKVNNLNNPIEPAVQQVNMKSSSQHGSHI